jgi:hypothetical protein
MVRYILFAGLKKHSPRTGFKAILAGIFISLIFFFQTLEPVVIVVHGSFAQGKPWWRPGGEFFDQVSIQAAHLGHETVPFGWSGNPSEKDISSAGELLAWLILSYPMNEHIILIGHSHGGNVINYATQMVHKEITKRLQGVSAPGNNFMDLIATVRGELMVPRAQRKPYLIERIYLLGTPAGVKNCSPQMDVVGSALNFYSTNDYIQQVVGFYGRMLKGHERVANLEVTRTFTKQGKKVTQRPGHFELHSGCIGNWLLQIPETLAADHRGDFGKFSFGNGAVNFDDDVCPTYTIRTTPGA